MTVLSTGLRLRASEKAIIVLIGWYWIVPTGLWSVVLPDARWMSAQGAVLLMMSCLILPSLPRIRTAMVTKRIGLSFVLWFCFVAAVAVASDFGRIPYLVALASSFMVAAYGFRRTQVVRFVLIVLCIHALVLVAASLYSELTGSELVAWGEHARSAEGGRQSGFYGDPNVFAMTLAAAIGIAMWFGLRSRARVGRIWAGAATVALLIGVLLSSSRGGLVACGIVFVAVIALTKGTVGKRRSIPLVVTLLVLAGLAYGLLQGNKAMGRAIDRYEQRIEFKEEARPLLWAAYSRWWPDFPEWLVGTGFDSMNARGGLGLPSADYVYENIGYSHAPHNLGLQLAHETGLIGALWFILNIVWTLRVLLRRLRDPRVDEEVRSVSGAIVVGIVAFLVGGVFLGGLERPFVFLLGLAVSPGISHPLGVVGSDKFGEPNNPANLFVHG